MTAHSDWNELRELSEEERTKEIKRLYSLMRDKHDYTFEIYSEDILRFFQGCLDRIKALVMSREEE